MKQLVFSLFAMIAVLPAATQDYLPPAEMVEHVLDVSPDLLAAGHHTNAARAASRQYNAGPHEWTLSGDYGRRSISGEGEYDEFELSAARSIRLPGKASLDRDVGRLGVARAQEAEADMRHQVSLSLMQAWVDWLSAVEMKTSDMAQVRIFEQDLVAVEKEVASGGAPQINLELARGALAEARLVAYRSAGEAKRAQSYLETMFPELALPASPPEISAPPELENPAGWVTMIMERSHEIALYERIAAQIQLQARRTKGEVRPDPEIGLRTFSERGGDETGAGVFLSIPLGGARRRAASEEAYSQAGAAKLAALKMRREMEERAWSDVIGAQTEREAWLAADEALTQGQAAAQRMRRGAQLGAYGLSEVLLVERRLIEVRRLEAEARARASRAWLRLNIDAHELWAHEEAQAH